MAEILKRGQQNYVKVITTMVNLILEEQAAAEAAEAEEETTEAEETTETESDDSGISTASEEDDDSSTDSEDDSADTEEETTTVKIKAPAEFNRMRLIIRKYVEAYCEENDLKRPTNEKDLLHMCWGILEEKLSESEEDEESDDSTDSEETDDNESNEEETTSITDLIASVEDGGTVELEASEEVTDDVTVSTSCIVDLAGSDLTVASSATLTIDADTEVVISDENSTGVLTVEGNIVVNGTLDLSDLGYTTDGSTGGLLANQSGTVSLGASATLTVPDAWETQWSTSLASAYALYAAGDDTYKAYADCGESGIWSPNIPSATSDDGIFASAEVGATVISGSNTWVCTTAFDSSSYDSSTIYWTMQ